MRKSKEHSGSTPSYRAGLSGDMDSRLLLGSCFLGNVGLRRELQILFGQKVVDETWYGMCVLVCALCGEKTTWPVELSACCVLLHLGSVRIFLLDHFQAHFPSHPLICLSLDANMGQAEAHTGTSSQT